MNGAREYAELFPAGQHGQLLLLSGSHARGRTFHIYVLPEGVQAERLVGHLRPPSGAVEVYGILGGQPGWTEYYGWIHEGPWQDDFSRLVEAREKEVAQKKAQKKAEQTAAKQAEEKRTADLLSTYPTGR